MLFTSKTNTLVSSLFSCMQTKLVKSNNPRGIAILYSGAPLAKLPHPFIVNKDNKHFFFLNCFFSLVYLYPIEILNKTSYKTFCYFAAQ
jgi:hypothetical protein